MCKKLKGCGRKIDPCIKKLIENIVVMCTKDWVTVASCCGHGKYPMTIVVKYLPSGATFEICHGVYLSRKTKFYKKDKQGHYYIPEVMEDG